MPTNSNPYGRNRSDRQQRHPSFPIQNLSGVWMDMKERRLMAGSEGRPGWEPTFKHSVDARPREVSKCKRKKLTGKHGCGRSHQSYFSLSKIRVCASLYTEMLTYQSPSGTTASVSMKWKTYSTYGSFVACMVADAPRPGGRYAAEAVASRIHFCGFTGWRRPHLRPASSGVKVKRP